MNKQELIERIEDFPCEASLVTEMIRINKKTLLGWVKELDEPQKVVVEQFVDDYIKHAKEKDWDLQDLFEFVGDEDRGGLQEWFYDGCNKETLALAWIFGYEVKKERRYRVKMKNAYYNKYPQFLCETDNGIFWAAEIDLRKTKFTRKELKEAGFGWVFNCPGVEIEEVEEW